MYKVIIPQLVVGAVMVTVGMTLYVLKRSDATVSAQTATPYSSTWTASKVLTVDADVIGSNNVRMFQYGQAGLGVWQWKVAGTVGSKTFNEEWNAPPITGISITSTSDFFTPSSGCTMSGIDQAKIMAGCHNYYDTSIVKQVKYNFNVRDVTGYAGAQKAGGPNVGSGRQATTSCVEPNVPNYSDPGRFACIVQTGAYSFQRLKTAPYGTGIGPEQHSHITGGGTLMPLVWTVTGTVQN